MNKNILITGGTGLIGTGLTENLKNKGYSVTIFTRNIERARKENPYAEKYVNWDFTNPMGWKKELENKYAVIHLAGANLFDRRWNEEYKKKIYNSRIVSTQNLVEAIKNTETKPQALISASGISYYGDSGDRKLVEDSQAGNDFLANLTIEWEKEAGKAEELGIRSVSVRTGMSLSKKGGPLKVMLPIFKLFIGGTPGSGRQWFPWIHLEDIIKIYIFAIENPNLKGAINAGSPNPVRMEEFVKALGHVLHRPAIFKVPTFALKAALGEFAEYITVSTKVIPEKLEKYGYRFQFVKLDEALRDILK